MILIAEIGNNHFGDFKRAKDMIVAASDSGADMVKLQAFEPRDVMSGSMPFSFYEACAFTLEQYKELIDFGREKGIEVFYSIFSGSLDSLVHHQRRNKVSAKQAIDAITRGAFLDCPRTFVSFPKSHLFHAAGFKNAIPLYATDYLTTDPELFRLSYLSRIARSAPAFGYSDHTVDTTACEYAAKEYGAKVIEKHFTMARNLSWNGTIFRDTVHGATPTEFRRLAKLIKV